MPRPTQAARERNLANLVRQRYYNAAEARLPRVTAWDEAYDRHDPQYIDKTKVTSPPYVKFPYLHRVTEQQTTLLMEATDASASWLEAQPVTQGFEDHAQAVTSWLDHQYNYKSPTLNANNRYAIKSWARMGLTYGNSYIYAQWDAQAGRIKKTCVDPYDVYLDARFGRWTIVRRMMTLAQLGRLAESLSSPTSTTQTDTETGERVTVELPPRDGGMALKAFRRVERDTKKGNSHGWTFDKTYYGNSLARRFKTRVDGDDEQNVGDDRRTRVEDDPANAMIVILEYYESGEEGIVARVIPNFGDSDSLVLQSETNPYGVVPIVPFLPHPVDNEFYGRGNGEIVGKLADAIDYNFRASLRIIGAAAWPALLYNRNSSLRKKRLSSLYGAQLEVSNVQTDVAYLQMPQVGQVHQLGQQVAQQAADFATGESDIRRGDVGAARNATAAAVAEAAGNITDRNIFSQWKDANEQLGLVCLAIARVHSDQTQLIPALGRQDGLFHELRPEFLRDAQWAVRFGGNPRGTNSTQQITTLLNLAQSLGPLGVLDMVELSREILRLAGHSNPDKFLSQKRAVPALSPGEELERLLNYGQHPVVSPEENLQQHFQEHALQLDTLGAQLGEEHPHYKILLAHFATTQQLLAQQQMQQLMAAGGGGSTATGGTGAGEAMVFNGATQQSQVARQNSNAAAAGQAPGPNGVVPNRPVGSVVTGGSVPR